jgi:hypothetical protein
MNFEEAQNFLKVWWSSTYFEEVCQKLGMDRREVSNQRVLLQRHGVVLKELKRTRSNNSPVMTKGDWQYLIILSRKLQEEESQKQRLEEHANAAQELRDRMKLYDQVNKADQLPGT